MYYTHLLDYMFVVLQFAELVGHASLFCGFGIKILQDKNNKEFLFIVYTNDGKLEIDRETSFDILK